MGIFRKTTTAPTATTASPTPVTGSAPRAEAATARRVGRDVILAPYLTEKSARLAELGQYTFLVTHDTEKVAVARAIVARYGVHVTHVNVVRRPGKMVRNGRITGQRSATKKAIVTVRAGEKIPFGVKT